MQVLKILYNIDYRGLNKINQEIEYIMFNLPPFGKKSPLFLLYPHNIHMVF